MTLRNPTSESSIAVISNESALLDCDANLAVLIDVREFSEFHDGHYPQAIHMPFSQFKVEDCSCYRSKMIYLICQSGNRARKVAEQLRASHYEDIALLKTQMENLTEAALHITNDTKMWSIDRQFRMTLGLLLLVFLLGFSLISVYFVAIPIVLCTGLIINSIIDKCSMRMGIALLPWNKGRKA